MKIKYLDLPAQFKGNRRIRRVVQEILDSGQFVLGPAVEEFEQNFAELCGVKHAIGISSGTDALFLALKVLGIGSGDEVITVPNSFLATVGAIIQTGAFPRLVDVAEDYNIDIDKIEEAINEKTRAIVPVHLTGNPARIDEIGAIAKKHDLFVVADAAQAVDASINGKKVGSFGDLSAFSLHPLKNLNTCGDGGVITTDSDDYYQQLLLYRNHGLKNRNEARFFAYNCRLDSIKAAVANLQIQTIGEVTEKRNRNAVLYDEGLADLDRWVKIPPRRDGVRQSFHTYVVQVKDRNKLISFLKEKGVETKIHYPIPIHLMEAAKKYGYEKGDFPVAEAQADRIISLPIHQHLSDEQITYVTRIIRSFYKDKRFE
ncbi:MAG: DegT/DnrJ/EryC1/StrS family aminotransferase [Candidatus Euphemobacter frigidus]|nr:DegT/DnrJ/EryC1/StrS family aminotransferase [Candidatus Euphemobacter frigidus]MDP8276604.1 DegT/DnrJ/EryC1/StrS family aminotransferase [Candidatus Euphemobacter frigidus]